MEIDAHNILYYKEYLIMKVKKEYLDSRICFLGKDWVVRFIEPGLYPRMIKDGFDYMFCNCTECKSNKCSCECHKPLENKIKNNDTPKSNTI